MNSAYDTRKYDLLAYKAAALGGIDRVQSARTLPEAIYPPQRRTS